MNKTVKEICKPCLLSDINISSGVTIVGTGFLTPYFIKTPLYCLLPFFQILSTPLSFVASNLRPHCSFCFLVSLADWVIASHLMHHLMILWIYICQTLVWYLSTRRTLLCVLYNKASSLLRSDSWFFAETLI